MTLEMRGITKRFPGVLANDNVDFDVRPGEVHALLGENGAGKSTLMNVLSGLYHPDEGEIRLAGRAVRFHDPHEAIAHGIGMVHQHFMLVPTLTVADNIMLGAEVTRGGGVLDHAEARRRIAGLSKQYGLAVDPDATVGELPVGVQQRIEIVKALYRRADILLLDEPTAVLTPQESDDLFRVVRELAADGKAIVFITHKLREVFALADRITVLRGGRVVGTTTPTDATEASLAAMMVGRSVELRVTKTPAQPREPVLRVEGLVVGDDRGHRRVDGVSLEVRSGEVLGIAGVEGNGQTELIEALTGLRAPLGGRVQLNGRDVTGAPPRELFGAGLAHVPEDRHRYGLVLTYPLADNLVLSSYDRPPFARGFGIVWEAVRRFAERVVKEFDVRVPSVRTLAGHLSGGNQQKAVVGREFSREMRLLVAAQPTRGVDVGSTEFIHRRIVAARDAGTAVLLVSAELDEVLSLADRVAVIYGGRIVAERPTGQFTREEIGLLMTGAMATSS
jgi:simple sugar transport system ATP-binding protein